MNLTPDSLVTGVTGTVEVPDAVLLTVVPVAMSALLEVTDSSSVGKLAGSKGEGEHVLTLSFECLLAGYPGWYWTVMISRIDDEAQPSVLETGLLPGENALVAPAWVPWSDHLPEDSGWSDSTLESAEGAADAGDLGDDEDVNGLHSGDIDGIDIDDLDGAAEDDVMIGDTAPPRS